MPPFRCEKSVFCSGAGLPWNSYSWTLKDVSERKATTDWSVKSTCAFDCLPSSIWSPARICVPNDAGMRSTPRMMKTSPAETTTRPAISWAGAASDASEAAAARIAFVVNFIASSVLFELVAQLDGVDLAREGEQLDVRVILRESRLAAHREVAREEVSDGRVCGVVVVVPGLAQDQVRAGIVAALVARAERDAPLCRGREAHRGAPSPQAATEVRPLLGVVLAAVVGRDRHDGLQRVVERLPVVRGEPVEVGVARRVRIGVAQGRVLAAQSDGLQLVQLVLPFRGRADAGAVRAVVERDDVVVEAEPVQVLLAKHGNARGQGDVAEVELAVLALVVELEFAHPVAKKRDPGRDGVAYVAAAAEAPEVVADLCPVLRHDDRPERRKKDARVRDAAVDVGVVAIAELDIPAGRERVARLPQADGIEEARDRGRDVGRRIELLHRLEFLARPGVLAEHEVAACKLQASRHVVRKIEQIALEREHAVARVAGVHGRDAEIEVEQRLAVGVRALLAELVGFGR